MPAAARAVALGQRLSGVALLAALLAGCDNSVAHNAPPPPPVVSAASVVVKPISQWDAFNGRVEAVQSVQLRHGSPATSSGSTTPKATR